jgi:hypothetical protein
VWSHPVGVQGDKRDKGDKGDEGDKEDKEDKGDKGDKEDKGTLEGFFSLPTADDHTPRSPLSGAA